MRRELRLCDCTTPCLERMVSGRVSGVVLLVDVPGGGKWSCMDRLLFMFVFVRKTISQGGLNGGLNSKADAETRTVSPDHIKAVLANLQGGPLLRANDGTLVELVSQPVHNLFPATLVMSMPCNFATG